MQNLPPASKWTAPWTNAITPARILLATLAAGACVVFLATTAYVGFSGLRVRVVRDAIVAGADGVRVPLRSTRLNGLAAPFAVVANVRNDSTSAQTIRIRLDDRDVCEHIVAASRSIRVDCQFTGPWDPASDHQIALTANDSTWRLDALEVSTHHGSNASLIRSYFLPAASHAYQPPSALVCTVIGLAVFVLLLARPPTLPRGLRIAHRIIVALFVLWAVAAVASPIASSYRIIVSFNTLVAWLTICLAPQIYRVAQPPVRAAAIFLGTAKAAVKVFAAAAIVVACFAVVNERRVDIVYHGNHSGPLALSRARIDGNPWLQERPDIRQSLIALENNGYDGQFMYAIAFDPFLLRFHDQPRAYDPFIDTPPYRYGRIGYPLMARILSLGQLERLPGVMLVVIYGGLFTAALGLGYLALRSGASPWWGVLIALVPGFWMSSRVALPEPVALAAALAGYLCARERRYLPAALFLAVSCLIRETSLFFVVCIGGWLARSKQWRAAATLVALALGPLCVWRLYVGFVFAPAWGAEAFWHAPDDFGLPFGGVAEVWSDLAAGRYYPDLWFMRRGTAWFSLFVVTGAVLSWVMARARPGAMTAAAAIFGAMAVSFNMKAVWIETGNAERLTGDLFFCLAVATPEFVAISRTWKAALVVFWLGLAAYLLFCTYDAEFIRQSLWRLLPSAHNLFDF